MNSSILKFTKKDKSVVTYKNSLYKCDPNDSDNNDIYLCEHKDCGAYIVLDKNKSKITSSNVEHLNHTPIAQRLRSNNNKKLKTQDNQINKNTVKRVSFSISKPSQILSVSKTKRTQESNKDINKNDNKKSKTGKLSEHQSHDAPNSKAKVVNNNKCTQVEVLNDNNIPIDSDSCIPIDNIDKPVPTESTLNKCINTIDIGTQVNTSSECQSGANTSELMIKIQEQQREINYLKQMIASLTQSRDSVPVKVPKFTLHVTGDSHVRWLRDKLVSLLPKGCAVQTFFKPGAGYHDITTVLNQAPDLVNPTAQDRVVMICGTNDIGSTQWDLVQAALDSLLQKFCHCKQFIVCGVPRRFDHKRRLNFHINKFNIKVKNYIMSKSSNVYFLDPNEYLKPSDYAIDRLHMNREGKLKICQSIANATCNVKSVHEVQQLDVDNDLILLDESSVLFPNDNRQHEEPTFSRSDPHFTRMFPALTPHRSALVQPADCCSLLDTPNLSCNPEGVIPTMSLSHPCSSTQVPAYAQDSPSLAMNDDSSLIITPQCISNIRNIRSPNSAHSVYRLTQKPNDSMFWDDSTFATTPIPSIEPSNLSIVENFPETGPTAKT